MIFLKPSRLKLSVGLLVVAMGTFVSLQYNQVYARDCDRTNKPYDCTMSFRLFETEVNSWCAHTMPGRIDPDDESSPLASDACKLIFWTFVLKDGSSFRSAAGFNNPDYCSNPTGDQKELAKDFCYVIPKTNTDYYTYYKRIIDECGRGENRDALCVIDLKKEFLRSQDPPWALPETPTDAGQNVNTTRYEPNNNPFIRRVASYLRWLVIGLGLLGIFGVVLAGIQYAAAQDNAQSIAAAKGRLTNIVIGLFIYVLMFAALQWLIPGGMF